MYALKDKEQSLHSLDTADGNFRDFYNTLFCVLFIQIEMNLTMCNKGFLKANFFW